MNKLKIVAIVGSFRKASFNLQLAKITERLLGDRVDFEILDFKDVPFFNQDIEYPAPESVTRVKETLSRADAVWFFTPEYNQTMPGGLKNLIDWLSRPNPDRSPGVLANKPVTISGVSMMVTGTVSAQSQLILLTSLLNMRLMNHPRVQIGRAHQQVNEQGQLELGGSQRFLEMQVEAFLTFIGA